AWARVCGCGGCRQYAPDPVLVRLRGRLRFKEIPRWRRQASVVAGVPLPAADHGLRRSSSAEPALRLAPRRTPKVVALDSASRGTGGSTFPCPRVVRMPTA